MSALQATGGKIFASICSLPTWGPGALHMRDDPKVHGTDAERKLFTTDNQAWRTTAGKMAEHGIGVDMFVAAPGGTYVDVATIGRSSAFLSAAESMDEFAHAVTRETGYQAMMKVRCSNGLQVSAYHGNFIQHALGADLEIGSIDADKAIGVMFSYDGKLDPKLDAHFQTALLYTTAEGQRRVRCINVVAAVNEGGLETMKFIDQDCVVSIMAKEGKLAT
ncbi:unnamed protein product [Aspergillus oryzae var. brunneus]|uniref:Unnamed protein product n=1 Tax=Aspergillus oryzae var. brunneus TaxID=332754 RepID=A0ABQ6KKZ5_ASPOZ|nr:unnamed protein product [Aspergillus oryzae var. brunneus]